MATTFLAHYIGEMPVWGSPPWKKKASPGTINTILLLLVLLVSAFTFSLWINTSEISTTLQRKSILAANEISINQTRLIPVEPEEHPHNYTTRKNQTQITCPGTSYPTETYYNQELTLEHQTRQNPSCPNYFRWIHEDLSPWIATGVTRDMVERAKTTAHFRLVIFKGKVYVETFKKSIQTRDKFTIWGILQLVRRYPGKLPDLELMFDCDDRPVVPSRSYANGGANVTGPPPVFRYSSDRWSLDVVFPDWSFWGWSEINIKPWHLLLKELKEGNKRIKWSKREPYAYWKGNPFVADTRKDLLTCNVSTENDWNARLFIQDWIHESQHGFRQSDLASQCRHSYKIYIEGYAWSVSEKYILACDSVTLLVKPYFHDFFTRSLQPLEHYWPIRDHGKCRSIKFAVEWGNTHIEKAQAIGKASSDFIQEELKMDNVYNYMYHLLHEYAKLSKFEPRVPEEAVELCSEMMMACAAEGVERRFMEDSLENMPSSSSPCTLPPPYEPQVLAAFYRKKLNAIRRVEKLETAYWDTFNMSQ